MRAVIPLATLILPTVAMAEVPRVATDIAPVHSLVARVMEGVGTPSLTISVGQSPHDYTLRPSEARDLSNADLVIWMGPELSPALGRSVESLAGDALHMDLLELEGTVVYPFRELGGHDDHHGEDDHDEHAADDDHGHGETHADHDDHGHGEHGHGEHAHDDHGDEHAAKDDHGDEHAEHDHGHHHGEFDPHAWLDPENAQLWLTAIAATLTELDPANAATYEANAAAGAAEIEAVSAEVRATLANVGSENFIVQHDAYQYFEERFGLPEVSAIADGDAN
ncbi:MAG: zinc ABC transporter substrate-binding protein, partial [Pseudomonadota bacterium]